MMSSRPRKSHSRGGTLGIISIIAGIFLTWGLAGVIPSDPSQGSTETLETPTSPETSSKPFQEVTTFVVVAISYAMQSCIAIVCLFGFSIQSHHQGSLGYQLGNIRKSLWVFLFISMLGLCVYSHFAFGSGTFLSMKSLDGGPHLGLRNVFWLLSTPCQWFCFASALTAATSKDLFKTVIATIVMQTTGIGFLAASGVVWRAIWFIASCIAFVVMFDEAFKLPRLQDFQQISSVALRVELLIWTLYPVAMCLRLAGVTSPWWEQVLVYSVLDIVTKTITLSVILATQFHIIVTGAHMALLALEQKSNGRLNVQQSPTAAS